jgi:hypothetical protein
VACVVKSLIIKQGYEAGEEVGTGIVGGYCIMQDAGFVQQTAVFTAPPPPEPIDSTMPF